MKWLLHSFWPLPLHGAVTPFTDNRRFQFHRPCYYVGCADGWLHAVLDAEVPEALDQRPPRRHSSGVGRQELVAALASVTFNRRCAGSKGRYHAAPLCNRTPHWRCDPAHPRLISSYRAKLQPTSH
jgi:hypothetical protein